MAGARIGKFIVALVAVMLIASMLIGFLPARGI
jgi:hypothetical protein